MAGFDVEWRRWPVVSARFGRVLGTVEVPGEPEKWQPEVPVFRMENYAELPDEIGTFVPPRTLRLRWDAAECRYVAPEGFPLGRLTTFQQL